jgi:hypothetical protein
MQAVAQARDELRAMRLLLFRHSLIADHAPADNRQETAAQTSAAGTALANSPQPPEGTPAVALARDPCVSAALNSLPVGILWHALATAMTIVEISGPYRPRRDEEIIPAGVVITSYADPTPSVIDAFIIAVLVRPELIAGTEPERSFAYAHAAELHRGLDRVDGQRGSWLEQYGVSAELAGQRSEDIRAQVTRIERAVRKDKEDQIIAASITPAVIAELRTEAARAFRSADIVAGLLAWAGNPPQGADTSTQESELARVTMTAPRAALIDSDETGTLQMAARLGRALADQLLKALLVAWRPCLEPHSIGAQDAAATLRDAIGKLRCRVADGGIAVLVSSRPYQIREYLNLSGTETQDWEGKTRAPAPTRRDQMIDALGLRGSSCTWQLAGLLDDVPVVHTALLESAIAVVDIASFGTIQLNTDDCDHNSPALKIVERSSDIASASGPQDPERPNETGPGNASGKDEPATADDQKRAELLQVKILVTLMGSISVNEYPFGYLFEWRD